MSQANSLIEGGTAAAGADRARARRHPHPVPRRAQRPLHRRGDVPRRLPARARSSCRGRSRSTRRPAGGLFEGLRFVARDSFMGALVLVIVVFGFFSSALSAALPAHAYLDFDSPRIAGLFYSALGAGALIGTIFAVMLIPKTQPLRLAAGAILGVTLPLWLLGHGPARRGCSRSRSSRRCCSRRSSTGPSWACSRHG